MRYMTNVFFVEVNPSHVVFNRVHFFEMVGTLIRLFGCLDPHVYLLIISHEMVHLSEYHLLDFAIGGPVRGIADEWHSEDLDFFGSFVVHAVDGFHVGGGQH